MSAAIGRIILLLLAMVFLMAAVWYLVSSAKKDAFTIGWIILDLGLSAWSVTTYFKSRLGGVVNIALAVVALVFYGRTSIPVYLVFALMCATMSVPVFIYR